MAPKLNSWHVAIAAEAVAAALFARCGCDVSVQYGANQPEYDLMIAREEKVLKVSVKGSQDGSWGLTQTQLARLSQAGERKANYHAAADEWLNKHRPNTVLCLVQFKGVLLDQMPRVYLATPAEITVRLKETANGRGDSILYEEHHWGSRAYGVGTIERIPDTWRFSLDRLDQLLLSAHTRI